MDKITITFLSKKGVKVCEDIGLTGSKESLKNKMIVGGTFTEKTISQNPLTIEITSKIPWFADKIDLDKLIITELQRRGLEENKDYKLEVA